MKTAFILVIFICCQHLVLGEEAAGRPLFVIGHMANCEGDILGFLEEGANAIETDVTFSSDGHPTYNYHGFPCDCFRFCFWYQKFESYLEALKSILIIHPQLALVYFDLKVENLNAAALKNSGKFLAKVIARNLLTDLPNHHIPLIIIGIPNTDHLVVLENFEKTLRAENFGYALDHIGYDAYSSIMSSEETLKQIQARNITKHLFIGEGHTNCFLPSYQRLEHLVKLRDGCEDSACSLVPNGVYHWTIDGAVNQRKSLRAGVDGVVTNNPKSVIDLLKEEEFRGKYRLAQAMDIPWAQ